MAKVNSGHAVNVENFNQLTRSILNLGEKWNPVDPSLTATALKAHYVRYDAALKQVTLAEAFDTKQTATRADAYESLNAFLVRVLAAMRSCRMDATSVDNAATLKDLIDGSNIAKVAIKRKAEAAAKLKNVAATEGEPPVDEPKNRSVSQQAYDTRLKNFGKLIVLLETAGTYKTNNTELTLDALKAYAVQLKQANDDTNDAYDLLTNQRKERDIVLYTGTDSLMEIEKLIKDELTTFAGKKGVDYQKATDWKFVNLAR